MVILDATWRNSRWTVGAVLTINQIGELKAYLGVGDGNNEDYDKQLIANYGCKLTKVEALVWFPKYKDMIEEKYWKAE
jgi:hypothetical protein